MMRSNSFSLSVRPLIKNKYLYTDEQLISRFQAGDENAFVELVNRYKNKLINFIFYLLKDEELSEDVVQETFIKLYEKTLLQTSCKIFNMDLYHSSQLGK